MCFPPVCVKTAIYMFLLPFAALKRAIAIKDPEWLCRRPCNSGPALDSPRRSRPRPSRQTGGHISRLGAAIPGCPRHSMRWQERSSPKSPTYCVPCCSEVSHAHRMTQQPWPFPPSNVSSAARVAASNTSSTPSPVRLEHSRYFLAPISFATSWPCLYPTNCWLFLRISSIAAGSCRRSFFRPTRMIGTPGHLSLASSTHCEVLVRR